MIVVKRANGTAPYQHNIVDPGQRRDGRHKAPDRGIRGERRRACIDLRDTTHDAVPLETTAAISIRIVHHPANGPAEGMMASCSRCDGVPACPALAEQAGTTLWTITPIPVKNEDRAELYSR